MRPLLVSVVFAVLSCFAVGQTGATKFEIAPFVGFETGASAPLPIALDPTTGIPVTTIDRIGLEKGLSYGAFLDWHKWQPVALELMWARNRSTYTQHDAAVDQSSKLYNSTLDQYQFGALFGVLGADRKLSPFVAGGLGFTHSDNATGSTNTAFAWNIGGGVKYNLARHFGLRADARLLPTYASKIQGLVCDEFNGCYNGTQSKYFNRLNLSAGVNFRF